VGAVLDFRRRRNCDGQPVTREIEVLRYVAAGCGDAEIAERLGLRESFVTESIASLLRKLGARNRPHAVAIAFRRGLVT
jgi:DNA-binding NarL/FixJ family response regulator